MKKEEIKEFVNLTSESLKDSTIGEEKLMIDESQFINWMIGLATAGFLFLFGNFDKIKDLINVSDPFIKTIIFIITISFILTFSSTFIFKISKTKLLKTYMFIRMLIGLQQSTIQKRLDTIEIDSDSDEWNVFKQIYELEYLPKTESKEVFENTNTYPHRNICRITYIICAGGFAIEYICLFILFYKMIMK